MTVLFIALFVALCFFVRFIINGPVPFCDREIGMIFTVIKYDEENEQATLLINEKRVLYLLPEGAQVTVGTAYRLEKSHDRFILQQLPQTVPFQKTTLRTA